MSGKLEGISIYPVKSLGRIELQNSAVERTGLANDRRLMVVDENGRFISQREEPVLASIRIRLTGDVFEFTSTRNEEAYTSSLAALNGSVSDADFDVTVWDDTCRAVEPDPGLSRWLSDVSGRDCRIVRMSHGFSRLINPRFRKDDEPVSFADGYPVLLANEASLAELNSRLPEPVPMTRFRPNIVVNGFGAFEEDRWVRLRVGESVSRVVKPCARCVVTTIDQETGDPSGKEPLRTLASFRKAGDVMPDRAESLGLGLNDVLFATNLVPETPGARISVGDKIEILEETD